MKVVVISIAWAALVAAAEIDWTKVRATKDFDHRQLPEKLQSLSYSVPTPRITNGNEATPGQFPYQVALMVHFVPAISLCGASIISSNYILTAAHCVQGADGGTAILGAHNFINNEPSQQTISFSKDGITVHPEFSRSDFMSNDVATIRLNNAIIFNDRVQPIKIPAESDSRTFAGLIGTVSGFGSPAWSNEVLRFTTNPIITNANCVAQWGNRADLIQSQNICLSGNAGRSACDGDSGGPLVISDGNENLQVGIVSFQSRAGCTAGYPSVYARVSFFRLWIVENSDLE